MTSANALTRFFLRHEKEFSIPGNRPIYTCDTCKTTKERQPGDFETARCACGGTMHVHFSKD